MARSATSQALASGLDHLFSLGKDPLALFRDVTACTEVFEDENTCWSDGSEINDDLDRQAVEQEFRHYEEDGLSDITSLVAFWEVGMVIPQARDIFRSHGLYYRNMNTFFPYFSTLRWTSFQLKQLQFPAKGSSHPAKKHVHFVAASLAPPQLRCSRY